MLPLFNPNIRYFFLPSEQVASTNVHVCNDITSGYPEGSHDVFHLTVSIQGCSNTRVGKEPPHPAMSRE